MDETTQSMQAVSEKQDITNKLENTEMNNPLESKLESDSDMKIVTSSTTLEEYNPTLSMNNNNSSQVEFNEEQQQQQQHPTLLCRNNHASSSSLLLGQSTTSNGCGEGDELNDSNKRRNTINIVPTHFVHKRGSQELPELVSPYRKIATTNNLKTALKNSTVDTGKSQSFYNEENGSRHNLMELSPASSLGNKSLQILTTNLQNNDSFAKYQYALENDDFSQIDFGLEVNSAQTSASEITFPVPKNGAFYGNAQNAGNANFFFNNNGQHNTSSIDETLARKNSVIDDSVSDNGDLEITNHYELYIVCIGDLDNCLVNKMLKTAGGQMYVSNRQVSFILRNNNEKVTFTFNFYSQFNWYLMDFLKDEAKDCHGLLFMFNITHSEGWNELKQTITKKYVDVPDFVRPSLVLGTYSHSNRMPSVVNTSQVINLVDKWKEKQFVTYLEIDVEDKDECKMALTHLATAIIENMKDKQKENQRGRGVRNNTIFSKICGSISGD